MAKARARCCHSNMTEPVLLHPQPRQGQAEAGGSSCGRTVGAVGAVMAIARAEEAGPLQRGVGAIARHVPRAAAVEAPLRSLLKVIVKVSGATNARPSALASNRSTMTENPAPGRLLNGSGYLRYMRVPLRISYNRQGRCQAARYLAFQTGQQVLPGFAPSKTLSSFCVAILSRLP